ncbi:MAG: hypothetical protein BWY43_00265 [candidate division WS2 bacterium ADurb.Bin280]|uniref:Purine nucleoside phosphorylase n=1 Tax=candidate division WS2 bacterium ADurb.Bin280 TaxID=1852829 RepID=A0A1V5SEQ6_9BACT|nr:MAG: hypothetical protein BWY43_00265 [candidate division WS2 bacterium ADurb.Bin280]
MDHKLSENFRGVRIFSSEKADGPMNFRLGGKERVEQFIKSHNFFVPSVSCEQVHGNEIVFAKEPGHFAKTDAALCRDNFAVITRSADCLPLMIFDKKSGIIGAAHVSRKNLSDSIIKNFSKMHQENGGDVGSTAVFLGPHIRKQNYKINKEGVSILQKGLFGKFLDKEGFFDLTEAVIFALENEGFLRENIEDCKIDTFTTDSLYSYRRDALHSQVNVFATVIIKDSKNDKV